MFLTELIDDAKKNAKRIRQEHVVLEQYQRSNPWNVLSVLKQMEEEGEKNIPTFDQVVALKEEYVLDDLSKVYHQIKKHNPLLINRGQVEKIYFYTVQNGLYKQQQKKGFSLGDKDNMGRLVTGSDLMIEVVSIELKDFLDVYYIRNN
jgi:hypothetical protein